MQTARQLVKGPDTAKTSKKQFAIGIFLQPLCIGHKIIGLYWAAHEAGKFQVPMPKTHEKKLKRHQIRLLSVLPP